MDVPDLSAFGDDSRYGRYVAVALLGAGGMGEVWKAWDTELRRWVALKFVRGTDPDELLRFEREAQVAARLSHPNIAAVYEVGEARGKHFIAMQYIAGQTLRAFPHTDRRALVEILRDAARAVHVANAQGVVHRDLQPDNIMVEQPQRRAFVMDFGLARQVDAGRPLTMSGMLVGTPAYMPPEQARGARVDSRADVYSLGATLYEVVSGRPPFESSSIVDLLLHVIEAEPAPVAGELGVIIAKAMEKDPRRRYATAAEFADDLDRWLAGEPISARPASFVYRLRKKLAKRKLAVAIALVGAALAGALTAYYVPKLAKSSRELDRAERFRLANDRAMTEVQKFLLAVATHTAGREKLGPEAERALEEALAIDANRPATWIWLGRCRKIHGGDAEACWDKALAADPSNGEALFERGRQKLERYLALRGDPKELVIGGHAWFSSPRPESASESALRSSGEADLARARAAIAPHQAAYLEALAHFGRGDFVGAERALTRFMDEVGWEAESFLLRAQARRYQHRNEEALADVNRAIDLDPASAPALLCRAKLHTDRGSVPEAERDFARAVDLAPRSVAVRLARGNFFQLRERLDEAKADYDAALDVDPAFARARSNRGLLHFRQGRIDDAEADFVRASKDDPRDPHPDVSRGFMLFELHREKESIPLFDRALELDAGFAPAWHYRGRANHSLGRFDDAERDYAKAVELDPESAWAWYNRGVLAIDRGRFEEAAERLTKSIDLDARDEKKFMTRGAVFVALKRNEEAEKDFTAAIAIHAWPESYLSRGYARYAQKKWKLAADDWEEVVTMDPSREAVLRPKIQETRARE